MTHPDPASAAPGRPTPSPDLPLQSLVLARCQRQPLAAGLYALLARQWRLRGGSVPLSVGDACVYDPQLNPGTFRRAMAHLQRIQAIAVERVRGGKNHYSPQWITSRGDAIPWQPRVARGGRPAHLAYLAMPTSVLDTFLGQFNADADQPAVIERWCTQPLLGLVDVGVWVLNLYARSQHQPLIAHDYTRLLWSGLVLEQHGELQLCCPPEPTALLHKVAQAADAMATPLTLTPAGWARLGVGRSALPASPVQADDAQLAATLIEISADAANDMVGRMGGAIAGDHAAMPDALVVAGSPAESVHVNGADPRHFMASGSSISIATQCADSAPCREAQDSTGGTDQHHHHTVAGGDAIPVQYLPVYRLLRQHKVAAALEFMHLPLAPLKEFLETEARDWPGGTITRHLRLDPPLQTRWERVASQDTHSPDAAITLVPDGSTRPDPKNTPSKLPASAVQAQADYQTHQPVAAPDQEAPSTQATAHDWQQHLARFVAPLPSAIELSRAHAAPNDEQVVHGIIQYQDLCTSSPGAMPSPAVSIQHRDDPMEGRTHIDAADPDTVPTSSAALQAIRMTAPATSTSHRSDPVAGTNAMDSGGPGALPTSSAEALHAIQQHAAFYGFALPSWLTRAIVGLRTCSADGPASWPPHPGDCVSLQLAPGVSRQQCAPLVARLNALIATLADLRPECLTTSIAPPPRAQRSTLMNSPATRRTIAWNTREAGHGSA